jgi:hypothetical protein
VKTELCGLEETLKECMDKVSFTTQRYEWYGQVWRETKGCDI